ncbi:homeobox-containing protein 1-like [Tubulanus polymorphus]|uniref:homeobox-containing protein 1-like n=1 Tax=Tubulanus polymorphus TaxID=672921 RepID=UPI003DA35E38
MSLFTIEQIELLRRLRNSGITKEQIIQAFDSLSRLDRELGQTYNVPITTQNKPAVPLHQQNGLPRISSNTSQTPRSAGTNNAALPLSQASLTSVSQMTVANLLPNIANAQILNGHSNSHQNNAVLSNRKRSYESVFDAGEYLLPGNVPPEEQADENEVTEFSLQGEQSCFDIVKDFVVKHSIKQHQLAYMCGLSQSYVSRYLRGDYQDISDKSKRAIYKWYLAALKHPNTLAMTVNYPTAKMQSIVATTTNEGDIVFTPRRERFVFRQAHLEVLERKFKECSYPSFEQREDIARECNCVMEVDGKVLPERERVNVHVVTNWFANKRKELKKIAKDGNCEGLENFLATMRPSRGRPPRSDNHNSVGLLSAVGLNPVHHPNTISNQSNDNSNGSINHTDSTNHADAMAPNSKSRGNTIPTDDQQLSLAVEVAAVNQAILALSGQSLATAEGMAGVKRERLSDDGYSEGYDD